MNILIESKLIIQNNTVSSANATNLGAMHCFLQTKTKFKNVSMCVQHPTLVRTQLEINENVQSHETILFLFYNSISIISNYHLVCGFV